MAQVPASSHGLSTSGGTITGPITIAPTAESDTPLTLQPKSPGSVDGYYALKILDDTGALMGYIDDSGDFALAPATGIVADTSYVFDSKTGAFVHIVSGSVQLKPAASGTVALLRSNSASMLTLTDDQKIGFNGAAPVTKPTVAGAKLPSDVVLASLLTALATLGLITDSST